MVPIGLAVATSTLIGQALGGGRAHEARQLAVIGLGVETAYGLVNGAVFIFFLRRAWPALFSTSAAVVDLAAAVFPVMYFYGLFDATKCVSMGILRGAGRPTATVFGNALACLAVGAPLSYLLAFYWELGLFGLWAAMTTAWFAATMVYSCIIFTRTDWEHEAAMAAERNLRSATSAGGGGGHGSLDGDLP
jgi:MATE family multidrug resistance protein